MGIRIRPASALTVVLVVAFALQLIAVLSAPVTRAISLSSFKNIQYGVLGYCNTKTGSCSSPGIGYNHALIDEATDDFQFSGTLRYTLAKILIAHIVAAGFTLILMIFTVFAHFHAMANSSRYLLVLIILTIPTFLVSLLAFIVDILLFLPHLNWGSWIVLGATVLILFYLVLLLIMKRTLSNKKARKQASKDNSELQNLNENNFFGSGTVYGGENNSSYNSVIHDIGKYEPVVVTKSIGTNENISTTSVNEKQDNTFSAGHYDAASVPLTYNRYLQTPSPSNQFRNLNPMNRANTASPYKHVDLHTSVPNPSYQNQNQQLLEKPSTKDSIAGNNHNNNKFSNTSPVVAGTYEDAENASILQGDSYSEFGVQVVPLPKIQNPEAMRTITESPSKQYDNNDEDLTQNQQAGGYGYLPNNKNDRRNVLSDSGPNNNNSSSNVGGFVGTEMNQPSVDQTYYSSSTNSPNRNNYNRLKQVPAAESQPHPYSSYLSVNDEYQPPAPKWRQQQQNVESTNGPAQVYPPTTIFPRQHQSLRKDYQNNEDSITSNTRSISPPLSQQEQQNFYQPRRQQSPQQLGVENPSYQSRRQTPQATDIMLNNNPDFELPNGKKQTANKRRQAPSSLRPGFSNLDGPYGFSRGI